MPKENSKKKQRPEQSQEKAGMIPIVEVKNFKIRSP
jgi:hypothetical protein